jgi:hypothetical protein
MVDLITIHIYPNSPINRSLMYCENIKRNKSIMLPFGLYPMDVGHRSNHVKSLVSILLVCDWLHSV